MAGRLVHPHAGLSAHPVYHEQLNALPPGFAYRFVHPGLADPTTPPRRIATQGARLPRTRALVKRAATLALSEAGYVRLSSPRIKDDVALIHSAQFLLRNPHRPYVVDFEQVGVFSLYQQAALDRAWGRKRLVRGILDGRCKQLLPWSDAARDGLLKVADDEAVAAKTTTVRPAIRP